MKYIYYLFFKATFKDGSVQDGGIVVSCESKINSQKEINDIQHHIAVTLSAESVVICNINYLDKISN